MKVGSAEARNLVARQAWLGSALRGRRPLVPVTSPLGTTARIKLDPTGLLTALIVQVTCPVTIATNVGQPGATSPYSMVSRFRLQDDLGTNRVVMTGAEAYAVSTLYDRAPSQGGGMVQYPLIPTALGAGTIDVTYRIPICADAWRDLRGAMYMPKYSQTYLFVDLVPSLNTVSGDDNAVYKNVTSTFTPGSPTVSVWQEYLDGGNDLPQLDVRTVHYLTGAQAITSGIGNGETLIDYPTQRSVRALIMSYLSDGLALNSQAGLSMRTLVRSAYEQLHTSTEQQFVQQRRYLNGNDMVPGFWFLTHAPEVFPRYSREYQAGFTPATVGSNATLTFCFDTFGD